MSLFFRHVKPSNLRRRTTTLIFLITHIAPVLFYCGANLESFFLSPNRSLGWVLSSSISKGRPLRLASAFHLNAMLHKYASNLIRICIIPFGYLISTIVSRLVQLYYFCFFHFITSKIGASSKFSTMASGCLPVNLRNSASLALLLHTTFISSLSAMPIRSIGFFSSYHP